MDIANCRAVVFENPGLNWDEPTQKFFSKIAKLKIDGYQFEYGKNVMPMSSYDFFGTHIVVCEEKKNELEPLAIAKISRYSVCEYFNHSFQPIELARKGGNESLAIEIENILNFAMENYGEITYDSSWTVRPDIRSDRVNAIILRIILSMWINYHLDYSINDFIVSATLKVGTDKMFFTTGCTPITENPYYKLIEVDNQKAMMFRCEQFSKTILTNANKYRELWDKRLLYGEEFKIPKKQII